MWTSWGDQRPLAIPECGFDGLDCPQSFMRLYGTYIIVGASFAFVIMVMLLLSMTYVIRLVTYSFIIQNLFFVWSDCSVLNKAKKKIFFLWRQSHRSESWLSNKNFLCKEKKFCTVKIKQLGFAKAKKKQLSNFTTKICGSIQNKAINPSLLVSSLLVNQCSATVYFVNF